VVMVTKVTTTQGAVRWLALAVMAVALVLMVGSGRAARAESEATRVILSYVPVVSNWGPVEANGVVVYSLAEGDVRADLVGLPVLGDDERYELWLGSSATGEHYPLTRFNAVSSGTTFVDALLPEAIPDAGWDEVYVTVEPEPDDDPAPSGAYAIVGGVPGTVAESQQFPPVMPETGEAAPVDHSLKLVIAASLVGSGLIVSGLALVRERRQMLRAATTEGQSS
jgi:hypothetical protein